MSMNHYTSRLLLVALVPVLSFRCLAGMPAGSGGFAWRTATPQGNTLRAVVAPIPGSNGVGLTAAGDASTLIIRQKPFEPGNNGGWRCPRGLHKRDDTALTDVSVLRPEGLMAACSDRGDVVLSQGQVFRTVKVADGRPLRSVLVGRVEGQKPVVAVAGDNGAVYMSPDGGDSFVASSILPAYVSGVSVQSMQFAGSVSNGLPDICAVGSVQGVGVVLLSEDAGKTFTQVTAVPPCSAVVDVSFAGPDLGFALGLRQGTGILLRTDSGGREWKEVGACKGTLRSIAAEAYPVIVAVGAEGICRSKDGGLVFVNVPQPFSRPRKPVSLDAVAAGGGGEFWAAGAGGVIFRSLDAGETWRTPEGAFLHPEHVEDIKALRYLTTGHLVAAGTGGSLMYSASPGPLEPVPVSGAVPLTTSIETLAAPGSRSTGSTDSPASHALAMGGRRTLLSFDSLARNGTLLATLPDVHYRGVSAVATPLGPHIWLAGAEGTLVVSAADSPFWRVLPAATSADLNGVDVLRNSSGNVFGLAGGSAGTVLRTGNGIDWSPCSPLPSGFTAAAVYGVAVSINDGSVSGIVVGDNGLIARTSDSGASWTLVPGNTQSELRAVAAGREASAGVVYVVGDNQTVLRSDDGGATFVPEPPPVPGNPPPAITFHSVDLLANGDVIIGGDQGHLLLRRGVAAQWQELGGNPNDTYYSVRFDGSRTGVAVGSGAAGFVKVSTDAGSTFQNASVSTGDLGMFRGVDIVDSVAVIAGDSGVVLRSANTSMGAGSAFAPETGAVRAGVSPIPGWFTIVGDDGLFACSMDGGETWIRSAVENPFGRGLKMRTLGFSPPDALNRITGFAAGATSDGGFPVLFLTTDLGQAWTPYPINFGQQNAAINTLAVVSSQELLAGTSNGSVYHMTPQGWSVERPVPDYGGAWRAISATASRRYVAGDGGVSARWPSSQGQPVWQRLSTGTNVNMNALAGPPASGQPGGDSLKDDICAVGGNLSALLETMTGGMANFCDVNRDSQVSALDAEAVLKVWGGLMEPTAEVYFFGDVHPPAPDVYAIPGDGYLTLEDAVVVLRASWGL